MKKALIISGVLLSGLIFFGYRKYQDGKQVLEKLGYRLKALQKAGFSGNDVVFDAIVELSNPTDTPFSLNTGALATLDRIEFYNKKGTLVAVSDVKLSKIDLPANSSITLPPLKTTTNFFEGISYIVQGLPDITTAAVFKVLGREYKIFHHE